MAELIRLRRRIRDLEEDAKIDREVVRRYEVEKREMQARAKLQEARLAEAADIINQHHLYYTWAKPTIASLEEQLMRQHTELVAKIKTIQELSERLSSQVPLQAFAEIDKVAHHPTEQSIGNCRQEKPETPQAQTHFEVCKEDAIHLSNISNMRTEVSRDSMPSTETPEAGASRKISADFSRQVSFIGANEEISTEDQSSVQESGEMQIKDTRMSEEICILNALGKPQSNGMLQDACDDFLV